VVELIPIFRPAALKWLRNENLAIILIFAAHILLSAIFRTLALIAVWIWVFVLVSKSGRPLLGLRRPAHWIWWLVGPIAGSGLFGVSFYWITSAVGWNPLNPFHAMVDVISITAWLPGIAPLWASVILVGFGWLVESPLLEEPIFRGFLQTGIGRRWGIWAAIVLQAALFSLLHPLNSLYWIVSIFTAGLVYGLLAHYSKSIWPAVLAHSLYNAGVLWLAFNAATIF
jgi:membrane protease YdiL (CAAX protease family)